MFSAQNLSGIQKGTVFPSTAHLSNAISLHQTRDEPIPFLSAAKPTDQGEESVVLLLLVVVGVFGGTDFQFFQNGCIQNFFLQNGCIHRKHLLQN